MASHSSHVLHVHYWLSLTSLHNHEFLKTIGRLCSSFYAGDEHTRTELWQMVKSRQIRRYGSNVQLVEAFRSYRIEVEAIDESHWGKVVDLE